MLKLRLDWKTDSHKDPKKDPIYSVQINNQNVVSLQLYTMDSSEMYSAKADMCMKDAKKKLKGSFFGNIMSGKEERSEEALELYKQAATNYKLAKRWDEAANAYLECINCDKMSSGNQSADYYLEAANMKERVNTAECIKMLEMAITLYISGNRLSNVAKTQKRIAQIYEKDNEYTLACKYYREAAENFSLEQHQSSSGNACLLKIVDIGIYAGVIEYAELIKILESVAEKYMQSKLTAPSAKDLYFKSILLFLSNDDCIGAEQALERYLNNDPTFYQTRQHKFLLGIIKAVKEGNLTLFSDECYKYNEIIPLDKWKTTILTRVKQTIPDAKGPKNAPSDEEVVIDEDDEL